MSQTLAMFAGKVLGIFLGLALVYLIHRLVDRANRKENSET